MTPAAPPAGPIRGHAVLGEFDTDLDGAAVAEVQCSCGFRAWSRMGPALARASWVRHAHRAPAR